jgi:hypothetical protein
MLIEQLSSLHLLLFFEVQVIDELCAPQAQLLIMLIFIEG